MGKEFFNKGNQEMEKIEREKIRICDKMKEKEQFYVCYERYVYEGFESYGWFKSDKDAINGFKKEMKNHKGEYYVGKLINSKKITTTIPTKRVKIFKIKGGRY